MSHLAWLFTWFSHTWPDYLPDPVNISPDYLTELVDTCPDYLPKLVETSPDYLPELVTPHMTIYLSEWTPHLTIYPSPLTPHLTVYMSWLTPDLTIYLSEWTPHLSTWPDYLPERVNTSPEHHEILHHLLAQVMVDPVDFLLFEQSCQVIRQLVGTLQVFTEWFLHHDAGPLISVNIKWPSCQKSPHYKTKGQ